jgi:hypothetical protein
MSAPSPESMPASHPYLRMTLATTLLGLLWLGWSWLWTDGSTNVLVEHMPRSAPRTVAGILRLLNALGLFAIGIGLQLTAGQRVTRLYSVPLVAATFGLATWWPIQAKGASLAGSEYLIGGLSALIAAAAVAMAGMPSGTAENEGKDADGGRRA